MPYLLLLKLHSVLLYTLVHGKALFLNNPALILKSKGAIYISPVDQKKPEAKVSVQHPVAIFAVIVWKRQP